MTNPRDADIGVRLSRAKSELRSELHDWQDLGRELEEAAEQGDPIAAFNLDTSNYMQGSISEELRLVELDEVNADLELALDGEPIRDHEAPAAVLGKLLSIFQDLLNAVAQVKRGAPSSRGSVPALIVSQHRLMLSPRFMPGSFAVRLRLPNLEEAGDFFADAKDTLEQVLATLGPDHLSEEATGLLGHSRVKTQYGKLLLLLAKENVALKAATRHSAGVLHLTPSAARDRSDWLKALETRPGQATEYEGLLVGGNTSKRSFHLVMDDGDEIWGDVDREAVAQMEQLHFGARVRVLIRPFETEHEEIGLDPKTSYLALRFTALALPSG